MIVSYGLPGVNQIQKLQMMPTTHSPILPCFSVSALGDLWR